MKYSAVAVVLATAALATPVPQGVTESIAPEESAPEGCEPDAPGTFNIQAVNVTSASKVKRQLDGLLTLTLAGGILTDQAGRTGYTAANDQFQFDDPPQTGAVYTAGFSLCADGNLALGGSNVWWQCLSGEFYNLYSEKQGEQCNEVYLSAINGGGASGSSSEEAAQLPDGQPQVTVLPDGQPQAPTDAVTVLPDGQPQAPQVTQLADGQPQAPTGAPVSQIADGQPQAPTGEPISQIADGQPQAPTGAPISQIADGQPQAPTGAPISQIADGQPQAPTGAPISQIADGQPQAPTGAPISQIADGQPQAPTGNPVSQIADGQPQAPTGAGPEPATFTGGAPLATMGLSGLLAAGFVGAAALL